MTNLIIICCSSQYTDITPEGNLEIFGSRTKISKYHLPKEWFFKGPDKKEFLQNQVNISNIDKFRALNLSTKTSNFILAKRTRAQLLASPFLSWAWNIPAFHGNFHPIFLIVGFYGGNPKDINWANQTLAYLTQGEPPYDRAITITWHRNALLRGSILKESKLPKYIARGGIENTNKWHYEHVDLLRLYKKIWAHDKLTNIKVTFIGFGSISKDSEKKLSIGATFANFKLSK